jgi:hypothetical protein
MSKQFKINANFRGHKKGDILPEWEYKKLPHEIKLRCKEVVTAKAVAVELPLPVVEPLAEPEQVSEIVDSVTRFKPKGVKIIE